jgi:hypothetical protein
MEEQVENVVVTSSLSSAWLRPLSPLRRLCVGEELFCTEFEIAAPFHWMNGEPDL